MKTLRVLWGRLLSRAPFLLPLLVVSSSVYAFFVLPILLQRTFLERVSLYVAGEILLRSVVVVLAVFYAVRSFVGGFLVSLGEVKGLYYEYALAHSVLTSLHRIANRIPLENFEGSRVFDLLSRAKRALTTGALRNTFDSIGSTISIATTIAALLVTLVGIHPLLAPVVFLSVVPSYVTHRMTSDRALQLRGEGVWSN